MVGVVVVVDMQNGVLALPRHQVAHCIDQINALTAAAEQTIFIQHSEGEMVPGSTAFALAPGIHQPDNALYVTKTACDAFWQTALAQVLAGIGQRAFIICGCATDYCLDTTIKVGASLGYRITVAADAHTTADREAVSGAALIAHHNQVWATLTLPGNPVQVKPVAVIMAANR
ncbi:isochorismatase family protein [Shimwellia pseudoproteus]|uniref:isochorismatase family protein n=1 Tax=Shimwellia pseudoproteus TaxID=570012 RepID=UPI0018EE08DF|nr:isochorismatase family protein [Shimwellia pseudoproteus]MBJ3814748.1 isochorismatase family protein [Shimwellia pseudoproteus]